MNQHRPRTCISLIIIISCLIHLNNCSIDIKWFHAEMKTKVTYHYELAYQRLKFGIIDQILAFDITNRETKLIESITNYPFDVNETNLTLDSILVNQTDDGERFSSISPNIMLEKNNSTDDDSEKIELSTEYYRNIYLKRVQLVDSSIMGLIKTLNSSANDVHNHLRSAASECEKLNILLKEEIEVLTANISQQENTIHHLDIYIQQVRMAMETKIRQVSLLEQAVTNSEVAVSNAENALRDAEKRVEEARLCRGKRFIGGWWLENVEKPVVNAVKEVIVKPICSIANMGGIDIAKDARSMAINSLNVARHSLATGQIELSQQRYKLEQLRNERNSVIQKREIYKNELSVWHEQQSIVSDMTGKFMNISTHLAVALGSSENLAIVIKQLIDFELVIKPLNALANEMIKSGTMNSAGLEISTNTITIANDILTRVSEKLMMMPLNTEDESSID